ncbi:MAG: hypothetical protein WD055_01540 [Candidatus Dependentiae bacterium]
MNKLHSFKLVALLSIVAGLQAYGDDCGPLERGRWYVMPKIGVAPGIFANRGREQVVVPKAAVTCPLICTETGEAFSCNDIISSPGNVLQENQCKAPKFGDLFSNGVLHVAGEIGHNTCDNSQWFIEAFYNRASGSNVCLDGNYVLAPEGCVKDCNKDCNTNCTTGDVLTTWARNDCYDDYSAYGAYVGHRHYFSRVWCDRVSFFTGMKFGIQHRKAVCVNTTVPAHDVTVDGTTYSFAEQENLSRVAFCKSNAVSGGLQLGADYCINDCLSFLIGAEVQVTSPFKGNNNARFTVATATGQDVPTLQVPQPTNLLRCGTGTFVQFPVWAALRWEFDFCNPCNPCA